MTRVRYIFIFFLIMFVVLPYNYASAGKLKPPSESFVPGDWFLGSTPPNYDSDRPPIVFVQGKNGNSTSWYGETEYHGTNDMYSKAYEAGYQTVFVQLNDSAGNGSFSQYTNGELLATMLAEINRHFNGKKVNIIAHSKGGPDTQAALIHYGAHQYVGRVITLGSPHHGSGLADLAYSWYAGWLATLLGQRDEGTYSLQVGQMAHFRSVTDNHENSRKNIYFTISGTNKGPAWSALAIGGQYLSLYGENDGLVNDWSTKLTYASHLFTDPSIDHDKIRMGSAVFSRIEPYLRSSSTTDATDLDIPSTPKEELLRTEASQSIHGGPLAQNEWIEETLEVDATSWNIMLYTATENVKAELVSPSGKTYPGSLLTSSAANDETSVFKGAAIQTFNLTKMEAGTWKIRMKTKAEKDAYLLTAQFGGADPITLELPGKVKEEKAQYLIKIPKNAKLKENKVTLQVHVIDENGDLISTSTSLKKINTETLSDSLPDVPKSGVYNVTIDVLGEKFSGNTFNRTFVRSVFIEKP